MNSSSRKLAGFCAAWLALGCGTCVGQWTTQTITLNPGWNAVYLEVEPASPDCDALFAGLPVESVWAWNRRFSSVQFIQDANAIIARAHEKVDAEGRLTDAPTRQFIRQLLEALVEWVSRVGTRCPSA